MLKRKVAVAKTPHDREDGKRFPNGIRVFAQALWQFWPGVSGEQAIARMSLSRYPENSRLAQIAAELNELYPGSDGRKLNDPHKVLNDIGLANKDLTYMHLRLMAEYVNLPTGLLLLFCHLISVERTATNDGGDPALELFYLLDKIDAFTRAARQIVDDQRDDRFLRRYAVAGGKEEFLADLDTLWTLVNAVEAVRLRRRGEVEDSSVIPAEASIP